MSKATALAPTVSIGTAYLVPSTLGLAPQPSQGIQPHAYIAGNQTDAPPVAPSR